jgi:hypothetical protein
MGTAYTYTFNIVVHAVVFDADIEVSGWDPAAPQPDDITIQ